MRRWCLMERDQSRVYQKGYLCWFYPIYYSEFHRRTYVYTHTRLAWNCSGVHIESGWVRLLRWRQWQGIRSGPIFYFLNLHLDFLFIQVYPTLRVDNVRLWKEPNAFPKYRQAIRCRVLRWLRRPRINSQWIVVDGSAFLYESSCPLRYRTFVTPFQTVSHTPIQQHDT